MTNQAAPRIHTKCRHCFRAIPAKRIALLARECSTGCTEDYESKERSAELSRARRRAAKAAKAALSE